MKESIEYYKQLNERVNAVIERKKEEEYARVAKKYEEISKQYNSTKITKANGVSFHDYLKSVHDYLKSVCDEGTFVPMDKVTAGYENNVDASTVAWEYIQEIDPTIFDEDEETIQRREQMELELNKLEDASRAWQNKINYFFQLKR